MTRNRNFTDQAGYLSTPRDECLGVLSGLMGGGLVVLAAFIGGILR